MAVMPIGGDNFRLVPRLVRHVCSNKAKLSSSYFVKNATDTLACVSLLVLITIWRHLRYITKQTHDNIYSIYLY